MWLRTPSELESKLQWGTDTQDSDAKQLETMNEEDHVKGLMTSGLDASRVEARIALKVRAAVRARFRFASKTSDRETSDLCLWCARQTEALVKDRIHRLERRFASMTAQLEERIVELLSGAAGVGGAGVVPP